MITDIKNLDFTIDEGERLDFEIDEITQIAHDTYPLIQTEGNWKYRIYGDNTFEGWYRADHQTMTITSASGSLYRSGLISLGLPEALYKNYNCRIQHAEINYSHNNYPTWGLLAGIYETGFNYYVMSGGSRTSSPNYIMTAYVFGTIEGEKNA